MSARDVRRWLMVCAAFLAPAPAAAQPAPPAAERLTLEQALQYATAHYPTVRAAIEQVQASAAGVDAARAGYLPHLDFLWQSNRATANNIFGQLFPQSVIPAMSGPVLPGTSAGSVWGSAAGSFASWDAFDFGWRQAGVAGAEASLARARAGEALTRLEVEQAVAAAYLELVAAQRAVVAAEADLSRRETLARTVRVLVENQLRPGAEASRVDAERAAAQTRVILARQRAVLAETTLARSLGRTTGVTVDASGLIDRVPTPEPIETATATHPLARTHQAAVDAARAQEDIVAHSGRPHVYLEASVFARGSGANPNGSLDGGIDGLGFDRANWGAGVQVVVPNVLEMSARRARQNAAAASERAEVALLDEATLTIARERQAARAMLDAAREVARNTPIQLSAARLSESQARARYEAGLASVVEVADAQNLLAQAEFQDQIARIDVWQALLAASVAQGDLTPLQRALRP